jgi:hypothetical protein
MKYAAKTISFADRVQRKKRRGRLQPASGHNKTQTQSIPCGNFKWFRYYSVMSWYALIAKEFICVFQNTQLW